MEIVKYKKINENMLPDPQTYKLLNEQRIWMINNQLYPKILSSLPVISQWSIKQLVLLSVRIPNIVQSISTIAFDKLMLFSLLENDIQSVQMINTIHMPNITYFCIRTNHLINVSSIRKCHWQHIQDLYIHSNNIINYAPITHMKTNNVKNLFIKNLEEMDVRTLFKVQSTILEELQLSQMPLKMLQKQTKLYKYNQQQ